MNNTVARTNRRVDLALVESGEWVKIARKHYRHESGIEVVYRCNSYVWQVVGGPASHTCYDSLTFAAVFAVRHLNAN